MLNKSHMVFYTLNTRKNNFNVYWFLLIITYANCCAMSRGNEFLYMRSNLARLMYQRMMDDEQHKSDDHKQWYSIKKSSLQDCIANKFVPSYQDEETLAFLDGCYEKSDWFFTQISHLVLKSLLSWFMTTTSINGYLRRGSMFVFSRNQLLSLLSASHNFHVQNLLDLGAGDGCVTDVMATVATNVYVTEVSAVMRVRLQEKNYTVLDTDEWASDSRKYDLIGCLNLLDRCNKPISMLHSMKRVLRNKTGRIIVAVVIPFSSYVEEGDYSHQPCENLHIFGKTFEEQVSSLVNNVFQPAGFCLERFTRLPYLCEGDLSRSFFILHDAVFVLKVCDDLLDAS